MCINCITTNYDTIYCFFLFSSILCLYHEHVVSLYNKLTLNSINFPEKNEVQYQATINHKIQETNTKSVTKSKSVNKPMP